MSDDRRKPAWVDDNLPPELANSSLFRFLVKLNSKDADGKRNSIMVDMLPDLDLDYDILEEQMQNLPAQYAYWAAVYSEVKLMVSVAERQLKIRKGVVAKEIGDTAANNKVRLNADQIKLIIEADDELVKADMTLQNYQMLAGKLWHMVEALRMKSELARSLAGFKRQERDQS